MHYVVETEKTNSGLTNDEIRIYIKNGATEYEHKISYSEVVKKNNLNHTSIDDLVNAIKVSFWTNTYVIGSNNVTMSISNLEIMRMLLVIPVKEVNKDDFSESDCIDVDKSKADEVIEINKVNDVSETNVMSENKQQAKPITIEDMKCLLDTMKKELKSEIISELKNSQIELPKPLDYKLIDMHDLKGLTKYASLEELAKHPIWPYYATVLMEYHLFDMPLLSEEKKIVDDRKHVNVDNLMRMKLPNKTIMRKVTKLYDTSVFKNYYLFKENNKYIDIVSNGIWNIIVFSIKSDISLFTLKLRWLIAGYLIGYFLHNPKLMFEYDMKVVLIRKDNEIDRIEFRAYPFKKIDVFQRYEFELENEKCEAIKCEMKFDFKVINE